MPKPPEHCVTVNGYTFRWDSDDEDEDDAIFEAWENRDWLAWLDEHLRFPFRAQRMEDEEGGGPEDTDERENAAKTALPFRVGSVVTVTGLPAINEDLDQDFDGVLVEAECQGDAAGHPGAMEPHAFPADRPSLPAVPGVVSVAQGQPELEASE